MPNATILHELNPPNEPKYPPNKNLFKTSYIPYLLRRKTMTPNLHLLDCEHRLRMRNEQYRDICTPIVHSQSILLHPRHRNGLEFDVHRAVAWPNLAACEIHRDDDYDTLMRIGFACDVNCVSERESIQFPQVGGRQPDVRQTGQHPWLWWGEALWQKKWLNVTFGSMFATQQNHTSQTSYATQPYYII